MGISRGPEQGLLKRKGKHPGRGWMRPATRCASGETNSNDA